MRTARAKIEGAAYYHVMNRILERRYILKDHGRVSGLGNTLHRSFALLLRCPFGQRPTSGILPHVRLAGGQKSSESVVPPCAALFRLPVTHCSPLASLARRKNLLLSRLHPAGDPVRTPQLFGASVAQW